MASVHTALPRPPLPATWPHTRRRIRQLHHQWQGHFCPHSHLLWRIYHTHIGIRYSHCHWLIFFLIFVNFMVQVFFFSLQNYKIACSHFIVIIWSDLRGEIVNCRGEFMCSIVLVYLMSLHLKPIHFLQLKCNWIDHV